MDDVLVSINCITYNHEKYVEDAIDSFLMQKTTFKFEILIHDDASTDRTADIIREYQKKYPDIIKPILQKENQQSQGVKKISYRFNHVRAEGKYIAICEGDDYWIDPYKLQKQVDYMENNPQCGLCFHAADIVKVGKGKVDVVKPYNKNCISPTDDIILGDGNFMATNSILYRKCTMDNAPDFYFNAPVGDYPLQIITSTKNYAYYINDFMSAYRTGVEGSWSSTMLSADNRIEKYRTLRREIAHMLNEFDRYSNGKYSSIIEKKIIKDEFQLLVDNNQLKDIKNKKYKTMYDSLTYKEKVIMYLKYYMPNIYTKLVNIKDSIRSKS